jgi:hypothetical protein
MVNGQWPVSGAWLKSSRRTASASGWHVAENCPFLKWPMVRGEKLFAEDRRVGPLQHLAGT